MLKNVTTTFILINMRLFDEGMKVTRVTFYSRGAGH